MCAYESEYVDSDAVELTANWISEVVYKAMDPDGNYFLLVKAILDNHNYATSLSTVYGWINNNNSNPEWNKTNK